MIKTELIKGLSLWTEDNLVQKAISELQNQRLIRTNGTLMCHAVLNIDGRPYRIIKTWGLSALLKTVFALQGIGLTDLLKNSIEPKDGFDTIWVPDGRHNDV